MGNMSFENVVASPNAGATTVVILQDDSTPGQVFLYLGTGQATGTEVEKTGLVGEKGGGLLIGAPAVTCSAT